MPSLRRSFSCPVELALEVLGGKWKTVLLAHLKSGPLRYGELRERTPSLSDKVLTQRLADLERLGLVMRHKRGGRGAPSTYELSARGSSLGPVLQSLYDWGNGNAASLGATISSATTTDATTISATTANRPAADRRAADRPAANRPAADRPAADRPAANRRAANRPAAASRRIPEEGAASSSPRGR